MRQVRGGVETRGEEWTGVKSKVKKRGGEEKRREEKKINERVAEGRMRAVS